ncbi:sodium:solute symporter family protein [Sinimarinibacterium thermocellulolyticum]|uniref:Sodium:solute symporter family protein n=1 Tax=Sinimarinibacterium thermocellulolyticum TaxID=3170016 RepID=A0ABV2ADJ4_9GAMM
MNLVLIFICAYIALQLGFAWWAARRVHSEVDYLLAGRRLGPWLATFTVFATWFGAETCIGAAGQAYESGLSGVNADPFGYALGIIAMGLVFAIPLWKRGIVTLADLFRERYGAGVERLAAIIMIPTSLLWAAAQIRAFGQVLAASSEIGITLAITLAAVVVVVYTATGGMWADAMSDLVQGAVLVAGVIAVGVSVWLAGGGEQLAALTPERLRFVDAEASWLATLETFAVPICGSIVAQELVARVLAIRDPKLARRATVNAGVMYLLVGLIPVSIGLIGVHHVGTLEEPEQVLMQVAQTQLPTVLYAVFVGALVSAILSTVDSALPVSGSLAAHNLVLPLRPQLDETARLRVNRLAVVSFGIIAYALALASDSVYELVVTASSLGSAGILVIMLAALWAPRFGHALSAYAALLAGLTTYVAATWLGTADYPYLLSLAAASGAYLLLSPFGAARSARA